MVRLVALLLLLLPVAVHAASASLTLQNPTTNVDGSPIPSTGPGSLASARCEWSICLSGGGFGTVLGSQSATQPVTTMTIPGLNVATNYCFRCFVTNTYGEQSAASNVVSRLIPAPVPRPPVLSSQVATVWSYKQMGWGESLELVGTAPVGTACGDVAIPAAGMYQIPVEDVTFNRPGGLRGGTPVTFCG
jgi:hypothetical protein